MSDCQKCRFTDTNLAYILREHVLRECALPLAVGLRDQRRRRSIAALARVLSHLNAMWRYASELARYAEALFDSQVWPSVVLELNERDKVPNASLVVLIGVSRESADLS